MASVHLDTGEGLSDTGPSASGNREFRVWFQIDSHSAQYTQVGGYAETLGGARFIACDIGETSPGDINVFIYDAGDFDVCTISTGSYTGWLCVRITNASGSGNYPVYVQDENDTGWTLVDTLTVPGGQVTEADLVFLGTDGHGSPVNTDVRKLHVSTTIDSDATAFTNSRNLSYDGSANPIDAPLTSGATASTNNGTSGSLAVSGSPGDETTEPTFGGGGGPAPGRFFFAAGL